MGNPLILKGFWNVRRLKKYRQKKLKIGRECGKNKKYYVNFQENIKWKQWKRQKSKNTFSNILAFSLKIVYRFRNNCIIRVGYSYLRNNILDILALDNRIYEAKKMLTASSTCSGASIWGRCLVLFIISDSIAGLIEVYKATLSLARGSESPSRI